MRGSSTRQLLSGLHTPSLRANRGVFSADFLYRVYDSKAVTSQVMRNYLDKRDAAAAEEKPAPPKPREDHKTFIDTLMESSGKESTASVQKPFTGDNLDVVA